MGIVTRTIVLEERGSSQMAFLLGQPGTVLQPGQLARVVSVTGRGIPAPHFYLQ